MFICHDGHAHVSNDKDSSIAGHALEWRRVVGGQLVIGTGGPLGHADVAAIISFLRATTNQVAYDGQSLLRIKKHML